MGLFRRLFRNYSWRITDIWERLQWGDYIWGWVRILFVFGLFAALCVLAALLERWLQVRLEVSSFKSLLLNGRVLRFVWLPAFCLATFILLGGKYIQDIYELKSYSVALRYLLASLFGMSYPFITIEDGKAKIEEGDVNLLETIGGPGIVVINPGNAVLFERLLYPTSVRFAGVYAVSRHERIKAIVDLADQIGTLEKDHAMTKDGIVLNILGFEFNYRFYGSRRYGGVTGRTQQTPYSCSPRAVRDMVYNRLVFGAGVSPWNKSIEVQVEGDIQNYIRTHRLDDIIAPGTNEIRINAREEMNKVIWSQASRNRLRGIGAELVRVEKGRFAYEDASVEEQWIKAWGSELVGEAEVIRTTGEVQRVIWKNEAYTDAQIELLNTMATAWKNSRFLDTEDDTLSLKLFLLQTSQVLESLSRSYETDSDKA